MYQVLHFLTNELQQSLDDVSQNLSLFKQNTDRNEELTNHLLDSIATISHQLYIVPEITESILTGKFTPLNSEDFIHFVEHWLLQQQKEIALRQTFTNVLDYDFHCLMQHIRFVSKEQLQTEIRTPFEETLQKFPNEYHAMIKYFQHFSSFWGEIDLQKDITELIQLRATALKQHVEGFQWVYDHLSDYRSKKILYGIIDFWISMDFENKKTLKENNYPDYYDLDLISCDETEVFVDLGAYTGDSCLSFIQTYGHYKKIYCYDITPDSIQKARQTLAPYPNIIYREVGVGKEPGTLYLNHVDGFFQSDNRIVDRGETAVPIVTLDQDITEPVSFIKMDIEGSEIDALLGAKKHIINEHPKLAVCTYHNYQHIWEVPKLLYEYYPDYHFYMRYNGNPKGIMATEFVTFAIPPHK